MELQRRDVKESRCRVPQLTAHAMNRPGDWRFRRNGSTGSSQNRKRGGRRAYEKNEIRQLNRRGKRSAWHRMAQAVKRAKLLNAVSVQPVYKETAIYHRLNMMARWQRLRFAAARYGMRKRHDSGER